MEKLRNSYDKEYMKMAMLKHEETFREQVYELHRLYGIQKLLMKKTKNDKQVMNLGNSKSSDLVNNLQHTMHKRLRPDDEEEYVEDDESELELTLGPTSQCSRRKKNTLDSAASFSSSSSTTVSNRIMKISNSGSDQKITSTARNWSLRMPVAINSNPSDKIEDEFRRDRHSNPSWLFQSLTLNTTSKNHLQSV